MKLEVVKTKSVYKFSILAGFMFLAIKSMAAGNVPVLSAELDNPDSECSTLYSNCYKGGWYLYHIGMPEVWNKIDLFGDGKGSVPVTNFPVGIIDNGFGQDRNNISHDGIDFSLVEHLNPDFTYRNGRKTSHGNMIAGAFTLSSVGVNEKAIPMIRAKTYLYATSSKDSEVSGKTIYESLQVMLAQPEKPKVVNVSLAIPESKWTIYKINKQVKPDPLFEYNKFLHNSYTRSLRHIIINNPDVLFVFAAGNSGTNSKYNNGMLHRSAEYNGLRYVRDEIPNLIVVTSITHDNIVMQYADFGVDVDIAAPANYFGLTCANKNVDGYTRADSLRFEPTLYGVNIGKKRDVKGASYTDRLHSTQTAIQHIIGGLQRCENNNTMANGTSSSAPLVSGAATILFHAADINGETITPAEVKTLLVNNDITTNMKYSKADGTVITFNNTIPVLDVDKSLTTLLNEIIPAPTENYVTTYAKDNWQLHIQGDVPGMEYLSTTDPRNELGYEVLYIPAGNACILPERTNKDPNEGFYEPAAIELFVTRRGDQSATISTGWPSVTGLPFTVDSVCGVFSVDTDLPVSEITQTTRNSGINITSPNGFYIRAARLLEYYIDPNGNVTFEDDLVQFSS